MRDSTSHPDCVPPVAAIESSAVRVLIRCADGDCHWGLMRGIRDPVVLSCLVGCPQWYRPWAECPELALFGSAAFGDRGLLSAPKRTPASRQRPRL